MSTDGRTYELNPPDARCRLGFSLAAEEPRSNAADFILPDSIRRRLSRLLAGVYALIDVEQNAADRFVPLIARLASDPADGRRDRGEAAVRTAMLAALPALRRFALSLARNLSLGDDLVQETVLRAWRGRAGFVAGTHFEGWAFTILRNWFYTDHRRRGREVQDEDGRACRPVVLLARTDRAP